MPPYCEPTIIGPVVDAMPAMFLACAIPGKSLVAKACIPCCAPIVSGENPATRGAS